MKTAIVLALSAFLPVFSYAVETNVVKVFTTNFVAAPSNMRDVDGQLYDITKSVKWESVNCKFQKRVGDLAEFVKVDRVKISERKRTQDDKFNSMGLISSAGALSMPTDFGIYEYRDGATILLKNFPDAHVLTGQSITPKIIRVGETNYSGSVVAIYDCGTPHMIPVVSSKMLKK